MIRLSITSSESSTPENPGATQVTSFGIRIKAIAETTIIAIKNKVKISLKNFLAEAELPFSSPSSLTPSLSTKNGNITVTEASEATDIKIKSGTLNAA